MTIREFLDLIVQSIFDVIFRINEAFINVYENNLFDLGLMDLAIILIVYLGLTLFVSRELGGYHTYEIIKKYHFLVAFSYSLAILVFFITVVNPHVFNGKPGKLMYFLGKEVYRALMW